MTKKIDETENELIVDTKSLVAKLPTDEGVLKNKKKSPTKKIPRRFYERSRIPR